MQEKLENEIPSLLAVFLSIALDKLRWLVPTEIRFMLGGFQFHSKMVQLAFLNYKGLLNYELCISRLLPQHHKKALFIAYWFLK